MTVTASGTSFGWRAGAAATLVALGLAAAEPAVARDFAEVSITIDMANRTPDSQVLLPGRDEPVSLTSAATIEDAVFVKLDMRLVLDGGTWESVERRVDQGFTDEPSGCRPGAYGPMMMEDGLRYFFDINLWTADSGDTTERVRGTIYPGNRSSHWANDVFCEFDPARGEDAAVMRVTGYYYVHQRLLQNGVDIQLRPVTLTDGEVEDLE